MKRPIQNTVLILSIVVHVRAVEPVTNASSEQELNRTTMKSPTDSLTPFDHSKHDPFFLHINDMDIMYDYDDQDPDYFEVNSAKFWGCFQKTHAFINSKSTEVCNSHAVTDTKLCKRSCELNMKCKMWSYSAADSSQTENCFYVMAENSVDDQNLKYQPNANLGFRTCKSGYVGCHTNGERLADVEKYIDFVTHEARDEYMCIQKCKSGNYPFAIFNLEFCACGYSFPTLQITASDVKCIKEGSNTTNSAVYKTGAEYSDTVLCIIAVDLDYALDVESPCTIVHELKSTLSCKKKCQEFEETTCWMWWYNTSHCKLIPRSVSHKATFVKKPGSFLGFRTCGDEDEIDNSGGSGEIGHSAVVVIAFLIAIMLFILVVALVCVKGGKMLSSEHRDSSDVTSKNESSKLEQNIHVIMSDIDGTSTGKPKKRYIDLMVNGTITASSTMTSEAQKTDKKDQKTKQVDHLAMSPLTSQNHVSDYITLDEWNNIKKEHKGKIPKKEASEVENVCKKQNGRIASSGNSPKDKGEDEITISIVVHNETSA